MAVYRALVGLVCLFLGGCTNSGDRSVSPPELNPNPVRRVKLTVIVPSSLKVRLAASYQIGTWVFAYAGGTYCGPQTYPPHTRLPTKAVPIALTWDGRAYTGEFFLDLFSPGRCRWEFSSLDMLSPAKDFLSLYEKEAVNYNFDTKGSDGIYDQSPNQHTDRWCGRDPAPTPNEHGKMTCTNLDYFAVYPGVVANELLASVPVDQRARVPTVNVFPFTQSITLRYHDLDAENLAAASSPAAHLRLTKKCIRYGVRLYVDDKGIVTVNGAPVSREDLMRYVRELKPAPKLACYSLASTTGRALLNAMGVVSAVSLLGLPLEVYTDNKFNELVELNRGF